MGTSLIFYFLPAVTVASILGCLTAIVVVVSTVRLPAFPGRNGFIVSMAGVAWWTAAIAVEHASLRFSYQIFWSDIAWFGTVVTVGYWAIFVWDYIRGTARRLPKAVHVAVFATAALVVASALTNARHHLLYTAILPIGKPPFVTTRFVHAPLFYVIIALFYLVGLLTDIWAISTAAQSRSVYRSRYTGIALATLLPWLSNILYVSGAIKELSFDTTPLSFVVVNVMLYWMMRRRHLFDLLPVAHGMLLDSIPDPVILLDAQARIVECNVAARRLAGDQPLVGSSLSDIPELGPGLAPAGNQESPPNEVAIGDPPRYFDVGQVSLPYGSHLLGTLLVLRDITHLKEIERRLQTALADLEKQLQDNVALQRQLKEQSIRDPLTGLHNRRFLDELGPVMLADARRSAMPLVAVMIDVDRFKLLNDTYGHSAGDAVLRATGVFFRRRVRESDAVFRLGGEEFLLLLAHTEDDVAFERVERWRILFPTQTPLHEGIRLEATFSAGIASYPADADNMSDLLRVADAALYRAKLDGRNRTVRHGGSR